MNRLLLACLFCIFTNMAIAQSGSNEYKKAKTEKGTKGVKSKNNESKLQPSASTSSSSSSQTSVLNYKDQNRESKFRKGYSATGEAIYDGSKYTGKGIAGGSKRVGKGFKKLIGVDEYKKTEEKINNQTCDNQACKLDDENM